MFHNSINLHIFLLWIHTSLLRLENFQSKSRTDNGIERDAVRTDILVRTLISVVNI